MEKQTVLVTGGSGFVGSHCILQLLELGYNVKTTIRSIDKQEQIVQIMQNAKVSNLDNLSFIEADLLEDRNWATAVQGCDYVLHVASPIFLRLPKNEDEMIKPAVEGTLRVLKAASQARVKRVIMTSNFGAVGYSHKDLSKPITEESWTNPKEKGLSTYNKSKVLAEMAAWNFINQSATPLELTTINPMGIFGPALDATLSSGHGLLQKLLNGSMKRIPDISLGIVDVRDVADLHIKVMTSPKAKGQRFLALAGGNMTLMEIANHLKKTRPELAEKASDRPLPSWLLKITAIFNDQAKAIKPLVGVNRNATNEKARTLLGWNPRPNEEAIVAAAESLKKYHHL